QLQMAYVIWKKQILIYKEKKNYFKQNNFEDVNITKEITIKVTLEITISFKLFAATEPETIFRNRSRKILNNFQNRVPREHGSDVMISNPEYIFVLRAEKSV